MKKFMEIRRRRFRSDERDRFVELYLRSGVTQAEFARTHQLKLGTLVRWLYRQGKRGRSARPVFQELLLPAGGAAATDVIEMSVGSEITLRCQARSAPEFFAQVIDHLRKPC